ncbi:MAG: hypothetical protein HQL84_09930 [Magnetococcales bacterium]|nr:hypothetical protein [Magnetococcales bacterium]MBF0150349.1 hypothetical protein [Magnetococcales bacterium]MBF0632143.1 hypothetical protein [Magnetococcales bacterium]
MSNEDIAKIRSLLEAQYADFRESQNNLGVPPWVRWSLSGVGAVLLALGSLILNITLQAGEYRERISGHERQISTFDKDIRVIHDRFGAMEQAQAIAATKLDAILDKLDAHEDRDRQRRNRDG